MGKKLQRIKLFIKIPIVVAVLAAFIVLGFFVKSTYTSENANMKKWSGLSAEERALTIHKVVESSENDELLIECVTKISELENSSDMIIRDAISLCYNGIKLNTISEDNK